MAELEKAHLSARSTSARRWARRGRCWRRRRTPYLVHVGSGIPAMGERTAGRAAEAAAEGRALRRRRRRQALGPGADADAGGEDRRLLHAGQPRRAGRWRGLELASTLDTPRLLDAAVSDADRQGDVPAVRAAWSARARSWPPSRRVEGELPAKVRVTRHAGRQAVRARAGGARTCARRRRTCRGPGRSWRSTGCWPRTRPSTRSAIVELSKAMYVMTPFTSLLVLENEDMYKQFKVDRGRKDHWAMYPAPAKIQVVIEPLGRRRGRPAQGHQAVAARRWPTASWCAGRPCRAGAAAESEAWYETCGEASACAASTATSRSSAGCGRWRRCRRGRRTEASDLRAAADELRDASRAVGEPRPSGAVERDDDRSRGAWAPAAARAATSRAARVREPVAT